MSAENDQKQGVVPRTPPGTEVIAWDPNATAPKCDPLAGYNLARVALEKEQDALSAERRANDERHKTTRDRIDTRLEEIHVALHGPRRTRKAKA